MCLDDRLANRQPQTKSLLLGRLEGIKNIHTVCCDSWAVIGHRNLHPRGHLISRDTDTRTSVHYFTAGFQGILEEIDQYLFDLYGVDRQNWQSFRKFRFDGYPRVSRFDPQSKAASIGWPALGCMPAFPPPTSLRRGA